MSAQFVSAGTIGRIVIHLRAVAVVVALSVFALVVQLVPRWSPAGAIASTESVYVTGRLNQMFVFNGATQSLSSTLSATAASGQFNGIVASNDKSMVWRTSLGEGRVYGYSTVTDTLVKTYSAPGDVRAIQISPDDQYLYASNLAGTIYKIRVSDGTNVLTISNGSGTYGMGISSDGAYLFVPNNSTNVVSKVRTSDGTTVATVSTGTGAGTRWVANTNGYIVATNYSTNKVSVIDEATFTELGQVVTGTNPIGLTFNPAGSVVYVASERSNRIDVIDLATRASLRTVSVGNRPWGVAVNSSGSKIYVGTYMANSMYVINTSTWTYSTITLASDQTMTIAVVDAPATMPTTSTTSTTTTSTTTTTLPATTSTIAPTTTAAAPTSSAAPTTTTPPTSSISSSSIPASQTSVASQATVPSSMTTVLDGNQNGGAQVVPAPTTSSSIPVVRGAAVTSTTSSTTTIPAPTTSVAPGPQAPDAAPGEGVATLDGKTVEANVSRLDNSLVVESGSLRTTVYGLDASGQKIALNGDGNLALEVGQSLVVEADGFTAGSGVEVWLHSTPVQLGVLTVNDAGRTKGSFIVPASLQKGNHRVLITGLTGDGQKSVMAVGLRIGAWDTESNVNRGLIATAIAFAVILGLAIPNTTRRRRLTQDGVQPHE